MQIETFEVESASSIGSEMAQDAAAFELIEKLGLKGQKKITNADTITRNPYRVMDLNEMAVYKALCPKACSLEEYSVDAIPLRVLEAANKATECGLYSKFEVWYPAEARIDDPVLVGVVKQWHESNGYKWSNDIYHIIARWGKVLPSYEQCEAMALSMLRKAKRMHLTKAIAKAKMELDALDNNDNAVDLSKEVDLSAYGLTN